MILLWMGKQAIKATYISAVLMHNEQFSYSGVPIRKIIAAEEMVVI
jgi:hypothetical protein